MRHEKIHNFPEHIIFYFAQRFAEQLHGGGKGLAVFADNYNPTVYFVELFADIETRLARNVTPHRLERKPSKKNVEWSRENLLKDAEKYRLNSLPDEVWFKNHIKIDNTNLSPDEVADIIVNAFKLAPNDKKESEYRFGE